MKKIKKLLIIGSNSFIGENLLSNKNIKKYDLYCISRGINKLSRNLKFYRLDLNNSKETIKLIKEIEPNYIVHLSDTKTKKNHRKKMTNNNINLNFTKNIIKASRELENIEKIIYTGSCDEYGNNPKLVSERTIEKPINYYGKYKLKVTKEFIKAYKKYKLPITIVRPSVVYGPGQQNSMLIPSMIDSFKKKKVLNINSGSQYRDFLFIDDLVKGLFKIIKADNKKVVGKIFNFSYGKSYKVENLVELFRNLLKNNYNFTLNVSRNVKYKDKIQYYFISNKRAKRVLRWAPQVNIKKGLISTLSYEE